MTAADIILIFIGITGLLIAFGSFVRELLTFLDRDKENKLKNNAHWQNSIVIADWWF